LRMLLPCGYGLNLFSVVVAWISVISYIISWKLRGKVHHLIAGFPPSHFLQTWLVSKADLHLLSWWPLSTSGGKAAASWSMSARLSLPLMCSYLSMKEGSLFCFVL
jgi:hypothetical protein